MRKGKNIMKYKPNGFTLIELLIVVAIIAILAAIAVPNFLEAQTRSKVTRAKADMRTISIGLEMFRVDRNAYPPDFQEGALPYLLRLKFITTPIGYMTSVPADPFAHEGKIVEYTKDKPFNPYAWPPTPGSTNFVYPLTYDYATRVSQSGDFESDDLWGRIASNPATVMWGIRSCGPDLWPAWLGEAVSPYDPTNGSTSDGNLFWTGPGKGDDQPRDLI
jgi:general secretion pathway protein G